MPNVMTTMAQVLCPHGGKGVATVFSRKWMANRGFVHAAGDTGTIACPFFLSPCVGYTLRSMGLNATKIDGRTVILVTDFQQSLTGLPLSIVEVHDTFDNSTPAPLPPGGQPAPSLPPELLDESKPIVAVVPPAFTVPQPPPPVVAPLIVTFTLFSRYPRQWMLFVADEFARKNVDVTDGIPAAVIPLPSGGAWTTPSLTVVVTLTPLFLNALAGGGLKYHFFMTGVSQRGMNQFAEFVLTKM